MDVPPLKTDPKYGYFPWWPEDGDGWVHPDDVVVARSMIPSNRVFCRDGTSGEWGLMHYGEVTLRVRPALWQEVPGEGLRIGDWVEVLSRGMQNAACTGVVREVLWDDGEESLRYQIEEIGGRPVAELYAREDLQRVEPPQASEPIVVPEPADED